MSTFKNDAFDYQAYTKENVPVAASIQRGTEARRQRFEAAVTRFAVRIDEDILEQFQRRVPQGRRYERLINQALREWLSAKDVKELVRAELQQLVQQTLSSIQIGGELPKSKT